ncbi:hypothetical protein [Candidatus Paracaedibacter symbiosus]|uniref:hypothetical protein n=1 Tax=Candidatus Paracaedibacter symbiosus TaxID=244582 RepID=UPI000509A8D2|nr:hypothetical protein [Candidatus Paracaedibacter symbiosus]
MTQEGQPITDNLTTRRPFFYRDKRVLLSFMISLPIAYFGDLFAAVFMHLATGILIDCWFFEYKKVKESDVTPQGWLDKVCITSEQLDNYSTTFMWLRHGAFFVSCMAVLADTFLEFGISFAVTFGAAYYSFRFISGFYLAHKKIMYPWMGAKLKNVSSSPSPFKNGMDLTDPANPIGFFNPSSSRYVFKWDN